MVVGAGAAAGDADLALELGDLHPSAHGAFRLHLSLTDDLVVAADPEVGLLHRGAEKLFEVRDFRQGMVLANRHDWLSAFAGELGLALAVERLLGLHPPERATWTRTLLAELTRVLATLTFVGAFPYEEPWPGPPQEPPPGLREREPLQRLLEDLSGGRVHPMLARVGGLAHAPSAEWLRQVTDTTAQVRAGLPDLRGRVDAERPRTTGLAVLSRDDAVTVAASGPVARASGLDLDLRRDDPYLAYPELAEAGLLRVAVADAGDTAARLDLALDQVEVALDLVEACAQRLASMPDAPVSVRLPKVVRTPEGATYVWTEAPTGVAGWYLVSRGDKTPWRLKLRTPSYAHVQALARALPGTPLESLPAAVAGFFLVVGDIDR